MSSANQLFPFNYLATAIDVPANGNTIVNLVLQVDSAFMLENILGASSADDPSDADVSGNYAPNNFAVLIQDQGTGRNLSNVHIPQVLLCGIARHPMYRRETTIFAPQTTFQFDVKNLTGTQIGFVYLCLQGYKIYPPQPRA